MNRVLSAFPGSVMHHKGGALFGPEGESKSPYRYLLHRDVGPDGEWMFGPPTRICLFLMLNPSIADAVVDDPTIRRCRAFAARWACTDLLVGNLFAYRATDPRQLALAVDAVGPSNDVALRAMSGEADLIVCAWGAFPRARTRAAAVLEQLRRDGRRVYHLGLTKDGAPKHPLYLRSDTEPTEWMGRAA